MEDSTDGRTARARRTRTAIVEACLSLVGEGDMRPTAPRVADRAGVSVRSVFQHFDDLEGLFAAVADGLLQRLNWLTSTVDASAPLAERIHEIVCQRSRLLEAMTPYRRAAAMHAPLSPEVNARIQAGHDVLRRDIERIFAGELCGLKPKERRRLLDALDSSLCWSTWDSLRTLNHRSADDARGVVEYMLWALLGD